MYMKRFDSETSDSGFLLPSIKMQEAFIRLKLGDMTVMQFEIEFIALGRKEMDPSEPKYSGAAGSSSSRKSVKTPKSLSDEVADLSEKMEKALVGMFRNNPFVERSEQYEFPSAPEYRPFVWHPREKLIGERR
ncbi:hypothetical protein IEQ34_007916 [Dendrobium chrysotoxum]|uniref:Uncharacterized protein n=1 Tax=Dendrobium chrysotoxum TaxID=161865 RepID=A0AAV7GNU7_DENCH|nr:hypothetical protein IEQ34_007916 [Dendrobium chrysotoxum]